MPDKSLFVCYATQYSAQCLPVVAGGRKPKKAKKEENEDEEDEDEENEEEENGEDDQCKNGAETDVTSIDSVVFCM